MTEDSEMITAQEEAHKRASQLYMNDPLFKNFVEAMADLMANGNFTMEDISAGVDLATYKVMSNHMINQLKGGSSNLGEANE